MGKPFVLQRKLERGMRLGYIQGAQWCVDAVTQATSHKPGGLERYPEHLIPA
jgi:hypothetical protein